jgi:hypothetical protein
VYAIRKNSSTIPGFSITRYRDRLLELHQEIVERGSLTTAWTAELLIAHRPRD